MSRFAILIHDHPFLHWDFLLEHNDICRTFRLLADPEEAMTGIPAEELDPHRKIYLNYEGRVSGGRGSVTRWDAGTFDWIRNQPEACEVQVYGDRWKGLVRLTRAAGNQWSCHRIL